MSRPTDEDRPAVYRDLFALVEYRAVFAASTLSWVGDYLCRAAVALLVFDRTGSALASAATFALGYLPWLTAGPLLATVAERYPSRSVMISCDLARTALMGLIAIPGVPVPVMLLLLFVSGLFGPPFEAARSAQLPQILTGDRYTLGVAFNNSIFNLGQVVGYAAGGVIAGYSPNVALLLNATTFAGSAFLLRRYVKLRPATLAAARRSGLWRETRQGYTVVFGDPVMRVIAFIIFGVVSFVIVPEGLAAAWASELGGGGATQGLIMAAHPLGVAIGGLLLTRLLRPGTRRRLIRPLAVLAPPQPDPRVARSATRGSAGHGHRVRRGHVPAGARRTWTVPAGGPARIPDPGERCHEQRGPDLPRRRHPGHRRPQRALSHLGRHRRLVHGRSPPDRPRHVPADQPPRDTEPRLHHGRGDAMKCPAVRAPGAGDHT
ncbi:MFS transporter [Actinoallomurus sp. CA-150999]|uniref:MFS transporter n=1 Tax=Actinoallomurus sp. CA-150999 TaxID=3239887 RepID=UPI003D918770